MGPRYRALLMDALEMGLPRPSLSDLVVWLKNLADIL